MADRELVTLEGVRCIGSTEKAALCTGGPLSSREIWFPISHIDDDSEVFRKGNQGKLIVTLWIAQQKGLVDEDGDLIKQKPSTKAENLKKTARKGAEASAAARSKKPAADKTGKCEKCGKPCKPQFKTCWTCKDAVETGSDDTDAPSDVFDTDI